MQHITTPVDIHHAAEEYASNHPDEEVRRMYGHHYRSFVAGAKFVHDKNSEYIEALREEYNRAINDAIEHFKRNDANQFRYIISNLESLKK